MKRHWFAGVAIACAMLGACGGGSSSGGGSAGGGSSGGGTPTPTPTPTPTSSFSYSRFTELTGTSNFATACMEGDSSAIGTLRQPFFQVLLGDGNAISLDRSTQTWSVTAFNGKSETFGPADVVSAPGTLITEYRKASALGPFERYFVGAPDSGTVTFDYLRGGAAFLLDPGGAPTNMFCYFGVPTIPADIPSGTTVTYTHLFPSGTVVEETPGMPLPSRALSIIGGSGSISGNTTTGVLTITLNLTTRDANGGQATIGPLTGTANTEIVNGRAGFRGTLNAGGMPEYQIAGGYFGPQGREIGFAIAAARDLDSNGVPDFSVLGGVAARR